MNLSLMDFQEEYVAILQDKLTKAKRYVRDGEQQAVLLSAPTGSGKTVMLTALIETVLFGNDSFQPEHDAVIIWLSDQPELNEQSKYRIHQSSDKLRDHQLISIGPDFDAEVFQGGKVYFINTQKLGRNSLLTSTGDKRQYTIWQTIENTARKIKDRFYLIVDEAHRGMNVTTQARNEAQTIAQKFLLGSASDGLSPIPLVIGISATPERFESLVGNTDRYIFKVIVDVAKVRASGLLKDRLLVMVPAENQPNDWTLLHSAGKRWSSMREEWANYCRTQGLPIVEPILVVQVEDAGNGQLTTTDLATGITTLEQAIGDLSDEHLAHCFQEEKELTIGNHKLRRIDPSKVAADPTVRIVFFKMALTTGWDCPRAEVMMSFRRAQDPTSIAQLIGRMVRSPLARRIESNEDLNDVYLYLPYYNREAVERVVKRLSEDADNVPATQVELGSEVIPVSIPESLTEARSALNGKPSYIMREGRKLSDLRRLLRFVTLLSTVDGIDAEALPEARDALVSFLQGSKERLRQNDPDFRSALDDVATIRVKPLVIHQIDYTIVEGDEQLIEVSEANADDLYRKAKLRLGDDIVIEYMRRELDIDDPIKAKLEIYLLAQRPDVWNGLESLAKRRISELRQKHGTAIEALVSSKRERYNELWALARVPEPSSLTLPKNLLWSKDKDAAEWTRHLYQRQEGGFAAFLNLWESAVVGTLTRRNEIECWLRNLPRKAWSLAYWYETREGGYAPGYPDILAVRITSNGRVIDIYEPHSEHLADSWRKIKGLAYFAKEHAANFGRIAFVRIHNDEVQVLDLSDEAVRDAAHKLNNDVDLNQLFERSATPL